MSNFKENHHSEVQRREIRKIYLDVWQKLSASQSIKPILEPMEERIALIINMHPEYHSILSSPDSLDHDFEKGMDSNPFFHMGLHIAIHEQVGLDQPQGIQQIYYQLAQKYQEAHKIEHLMIDCLEQFLNDSQRLGDSLGVDTMGYIDCLKLKL